MPGVLEMALTSNLKSLLSEIERKNHLDDGCLYRLLRFLSATCRTHLIKLGDHQLMREMETPHQVRTCGLFLSQ